VNDTRELFIHTLLTATKIAEIRANTNVTIRDKINITLATIIANHFYTNTVYYSSEVILEFDVLLLFILNYPIKILKSCNG
jgi:hypothetical protein